MQVSSKQKGPTRTKPNGFFYYLCNDFSEITISGQQAKKDIMIKTLLKILPSPLASGSSIAGGIFYSNSIASSDAADGDVYLTSHVYREIFGEKKNRAKDSHKLLSIVKVSANGKSIHRAFRGATTTGFTSNHAALSPSSISLLNDADGKEPSEVVLSKGCWIPFYWGHPDKAIRMATRLGAVSLFLGLVSLVISIIGLI